MLLLAFNEKKLRGSYTSSYDTGILQILSKLHKDKLRIN